MGFLRNIIHGTIYPLPLPSNYQEMRLSSQLENSQCVRLFYWLMAQWLMTYDQRRNRPPKNANNFKDPFTAKFFISVHTVLQFLLIASEWIYRLNFFKSFFRRKFLIGCTRILTNEMRKVLLEERFKVLLPLKRNTDTHDSTRFLEPD